MFPFVHNIPNVEIQRAINIPAAAFVCILAGAAVPSCLAAPVESVTWTTFAGVAKRVNFTSQTHRPADKQVGLLFWLGGFFARSPASLL